MTKFRLPAEWEKQSYIQLTWPHKGTDWAYMLEEVEDCFFRIAKEIATRQPLIVVAPEYPECLKGTDFEKNIHFVELLTNDTWARDHSFITMVDDEENARLLDFQFNGWGMKFAANFDNLINECLSDEWTEDGKPLLNGDYEKHLDFVLEGGSIESDGEGTLLTTTECLMEANRNPMMEQDEIEAYLKQIFHLKKVLWLNDGFLCGDDTDSHVDTLARLCPNHTIVYVKCEDKDDIHYEALKNMEQQLSEMTAADGKPYRLLPVPLPHPICDEDGERLPATYANFLIMNEAVLYPTYGQPEFDSQAKESLQKAFPDREIVGIDCRALIKQHGSLHCVTMQYPECVKK